MKLASEPLASRWRNTIDGRLMAANALLVAASHELELLAVVDAADELARRSLDVLAAAASTLIADLRQKLHGMRYPLALGACPHCATERPTLPSGHCPRCTRVRSVANGERSANRS